MDGGEAVSKLEIRNPKLEANSDIEVRNQLGQSLLFRASNLLRISNFEFRISPAVPCHFMTLNVCSSCTYGHPGVRVFISYE